MKIAFYSPLDVALVGGVRSWLVDFWPRYLETRNAMLHIVHTGTRPSRFKESYLDLPQNARISLQTLKGPALPGSGGRLPSARQLARAIEGADLCYFDNGYAFQDVVVLEAARKINLPLVSGHHAVIRFGGLHDVAWNWVGRRMMQRFAAVHALNSRDAEYLRSVGAQNVHVVPIAIDLDAFTPQPLRPHTFTALFVGRFHFQKGIDRLVNLIQLAHQRYGADMHFIVIGSGPLVEDVRRLSALANVTLARSGDRNEIAGLMSRAHVLLVPSRWETFGIVAAEALAAGTPIIATDAGAMREMAEQGRGEIVEDADDAAAWCAALEAARARYRADGSYSHEVATAARRYAERSFSFDRTAQLFDVLLESAIR